MLGEEVHLGKKNKVATRNVLGGYSSVPIQETTSITTLVLV